MLTSLFETSALMLYNEYLQLKKNKDKIEKEFGTQEYNQRLADMLDRIERHSDW